MEMLRKFVGSCIGRRGDQDLYLGYAEMVSEYGNLWGPGAPPKRLMAR